MNLEDQVAQGAAASGLGEEEGRLSAGDVVRAYARQSIHIAADKGTRLERAGAPPSDDIIRAGAAGSARVGPVGELVRSIQASALRSMEGPVAFEPTANSVFEVGIKRGTPVVFQIVPESSAYSAPSIASLARSELSRTDRALGKVYFDKCALSSINRPAQERYQIVEMFGADVIYAFGRRPRIYSMTGTLISGRSDVSFNGATISQDFAAAWERAFSDHFRLTRCVLNRKVIRVWLLDMIMTGYLLDLNMFVDQEMQANTQFTMSFALKRLSYLKNGDANLPGQNEGRNIQWTRNAIFARSTSSSDDRFELPDERRELQPEPAKEQAAEIFKSKKQAEDLTSQLADMLGIFKPSEAYEELKSRLSSKEARELKKGPVGLGQLMLREVASMKIESLSNLIAGIRTLDETIAKAPDAKRKAELESAKRIGVETFKKLVADADVLAQRAVMAYEIYETSSPPQAISDVPAALLGAGEVVA